MTAHKDCAAALAQLLITILSTQCDRKTIVIQFSSSPVTHKSNALLPQMQRSQGSKFLLVHDQHHALRTTGNPHCTGQLDQQVLQVTSVFSLVCTDNAVGTLSWAKRRHQCHSCDGVVYHGKRTAKPSTLKLDWTCMRKIRQITTRRDTNTVYLRLAASSVAITNVQCSNPIANEIIHKIETYRPRPINAKITILLLNHSRTGKEYPKQKLE